MPPPFTLQPDVPAPPDPPGGHWQRVDPRFRPVWEGRSPAEQEALSRYFLPHRSTRAVLTPSRPRLIKWYCPFADQGVFPSGHRYCINVYTGCSHGCQYCYAAAYEPARAGRKQRFADLLARDLADLERFDVPPAPVHLSNSTDPFQALELVAGDTRRALEGLLAHRRRFSTVTILTKNPELAARPDYVAVLRELGEIRPDHPAAPRWQALGHPAVQVEVSLAFARETAAAFWDPGAPSVARRREGILALREAGIPVVLRVDPLFPRSPLPGVPPRSLTDFGLVEAQSLDDLEDLATFAAACGVRHVVHSPLRIVRPRGAPLPPAMAGLLEVYRALAAPLRPVWRAGGWRLPPPVARHGVTEPFLAILAQAGLPARFCMRNLIETP